MRTTPLLRSLAVTITLGACGDDEAARDTSVGTDATTAMETADSATATETADSTTATETAEDVAATETAEEVAAETIEDVADVDDGDTSACEYFEEPRVFECNGALTQAFRWVAGGEGCEPYYTLGEDRYETAAELAAAHQCDAACEYVAVRSVDFISCVGGTRNGFDQYEAAGEGCLEGVAQSSAGLFRDICQWHEIACLPMCTPGCREGDAGDPDAAQLSGASGTYYVTPVHVLGQSFVVARAGVITGIEVRLGACDYTGDAVLTVLDAEGNELGAAQRPVGGDPTACANGSSLVEGAPGDNVFDLTGSCLRVTAGQSLTFQVSLPSDVERGVCDDDTNVCTAGRTSMVCSFDQECDNIVGLGVDETNPYASGTLVANGGANPGVDAAFRVFVE